MSERLLREAAPPRPECICEDEFIDAGHIPACPLHVPRPTRYGPESDDALAELRASVAPLEEAGEPLTDAMQKVVDAAWEFDDTLIARRGERSLRLAQALHEYRLLLASGGHT